MKLVLMILLLLSAVGCFKSPGTAMININGKIVYCDNWYINGCGMNFQDCNTGLNYSCRMNQTWEIVK